MEIADNSLELKELMLKFDKEVNLINSFLERAFLKKTLKICNTVKSLLFSWKIW